MLNRQELQEKSNQKPSKYAKLFTSKRKRENQIKPEN